MDEYVIVVGGASESMAIVQAVHDFGLLAIVVDWDERAPASQVADRYVETDTRYPEALDVTLEAVSGLKVVAVVPAITQYAIPLASMLWGHYGHDRVTAGSVDKVALHHRLEDADIRTPRTFVDAPVMFPCFAKPDKWSRGVMVQWLADEDQYGAWLERYLSTTASPFEARKIAPSAHHLTQEPIRGDLYAVDIVGSYVHTLRCYTDVSYHDDEGLPCAPYMYRAEMVDEPDIQALGVAAARACFPNGDCVFGDVDIMVSHDDGRPYVLEVNTRFGDFDLMLAAFSRGVNLYAASVQWAVQGKIDWNEWPVRVGPGRAQLGRLTRMEARYVTLPQIVAPHRQVYPFSDMGVLYYYVAEDMDSPPLDTHLDGV